MSQHSEQQLAHASPSALKDIVTVTYLDHHNCSFSKVNGFLSMRATVTSGQTSLWEQHTVQGENRDELREVVLDRVFLHRAFPFDMPYECIAVFDRDKHEIGFIRSIANDFDEETAALLRRELEETYYCPLITRILSVKDHYGMSHWHVECDFGETEFTIQDVYRNLRKVPTADGHERIFLQDVYGNRYEIPNVESLDRASYKRIELYL